MVITWNSFLIYLLQSRKPCKTFLPNVRRMQLSKLAWNVFSQNICGSTLMWAQTWPTRTSQQQVPVRWNVWENFLLFVCKQKFEITFVPVWSSLCAATFKKHNKKSCSAVSWPCASHTYSHEVMKNSVNAEFPDQAGLFVLFCNRCP